MYKMMGKHFTLKKIVCTETGSGSNLKAKIAYKNSEKKKPPPSKKIHSVELTLHKNLIPNHFHMVKHTFVLMVPMQVLYFPY